MCSAVVRQSYKHTSFGRLEVRLDTGLELMLRGSTRHRGARVLATIVAAAGSTYRKVGARMLIMADGSHAGLLTGGCFEADLIAHAKSVLRTRVPVTIEYDMRGPDDLLFGIGSGCEGAMRILLEYAGPDSLADAALAHASRTVTVGDATVLLVIHESSDWVLGTHTASSRLPSVLAAAAERSLSESSSSTIDFEVDGRRAQALVQFLAPSPQILICGAGPDAQPVANAAIALGWRVVVVDHRPAYALPERFPGAVVLLTDARALRDIVDVDRCHAAVVMSHHLPSDVAYLRELAASDWPGYVGLLGPTARRQRIAEELGVSATSLGSRIHGPVGLDIGAITPESIAVAIIGEIHAWLAGRMGGP